MKPKSEEILELEDALRSDLRGILKDELKDVEEKELEELENRIMNQASMHMCQRREVDR
jgi:hypothetical protein